MGYCPVMPHIVDGAMPAICRPMPVTADAMKANGSSRSIRNDIFWLASLAETVLSNLKNTLLWQVLMHLPQPIQASAFLNTVCLCRKKPAFPITFFGHFSTHSQHAVQRRGFIATYSVVNFFIAIAFYCKIRWLGSEMTWT